LDHLRLREGPALARVERSLIPFSR
jgi:hypothetical protein